MTKEDLHIHTTASDGSNTPEEIVDIVKKNKIKTFSITDHETVAGVKKLIGQAELLRELTFIPGIELTVQKSDSKKMHILGYDYDLDGSSISTITGQAEVYGIENMDLYFYLLNKMFNLNITNQEIDEVMTSDKCIGKLRIAELLVKRGNAKTINEAYDVYINPMNEIAKAYKKGVTEEEVINAIINDGGIAALAHAKTLGLADYNELKKKIDILKSYGLGAIEVQHPLHNPEYRQMLLQIADELDLLISGGSDYHGKSKPHIQIGVGGDSFDDKSYSIDLNNSSITEEIKQRHK